MVPKDFIEHLNGVLVGLLHLFRDFGTHAAWNKIRILVPGKLSCVLGGRIPNLGDERAWLPGERIDPARVHENSCCDPYWKWADSPQILLCWHPNHRYQA